MQFFFSIDGTKYYLLMRATIRAQPISSYTDLVLCLKNIETDLQFLGCIRPVHGTRWGAKDDNVNIRVRNKNEGRPIISSINKKSEIKKYEAFFSVKWFLGERFKDVKHIKLDGTWKHRKCFFEDSQFDYNITNSSMLYSTVNQLKNIRMKVVAKADAIVITKVGKGEVIKVCNTVGTEVRSTVTKRDIIQIQLPKNQIYFVNIGNSRYKVAL